MEAPTPDAPLSSPQSVGRPRRFGVIFPQPQRRGPRGINRVGETRRRRTRMSPSRHQYLARMLRCGLLVGLLALQAIPAAEASFRVYVVNHNDNNVVVFDADTLQRVGPPLPAGESP